MDKCYIHQMVGQHGKCENLEMKGGMENIALFLGYACDAECRDMDNDSSFARVYFAL